ncbi:MAG: hemolysin family protein [Patescibacteria group bacterium]|jgi:putative hemolysin
MISEIAIVFLLTLLNGFFSMSEIAFIAVRKTHLAGLVKKGNRRAQIIQQLYQKPERMFATIQIGISVITIAASAFAGSSIARELASFLSRFDIPFVAEHAYAISFTTVVVVVAYVNIVIGELVPKSLGLRYAETLALLAAYPVWWLSKINALPIKALNVSSNLLLKLFHDSTTFTETKLSEEEIRALLLESRRAGTIESHEHNIIENVFDFSDLSVRQIMIPRTHMVAFDINEPARDVVHKAIESGYSRVPIYEGTMNNIIGILYTKRLLPKFEKGMQGLQLREFLLPPYFVPGTMKIGQVLQRIQRKKAHMALVADEHGEIEGLVTLEDILEEIVGDITDETDEVSGAIKQEGDKLLVVGDVSIIDFNKHLQSELPENEDFTTVSGFILDRLGRFPKIGDVVEHKDIQLIVKETTLRTVKVAVVERVKKN